MAVMCGWLRNTPPWSRRRPDEGQVDNVWSVCGREGTTVAWKGLRVCLTDESVGGMEQEWSRGGEGKLCRLRD